MERPGSASCVFYQEEAEGSGNDLHIYQDISGGSMGVNSKYLRYREPGQQANVNNVERFGMPARSLFTSTKILSLRHHIDITDEQGKIVYQSKSKIISIKDKTDITDANGHKVAHIERKVFTIHEKHEVTMADGTFFVLSTELLHLVRDVINLEGLGWQICGNIAELNFEVYDVDNTIIANISQKMISIHDKYCIDIYRPECEAIVVAILVTLQHMIADRENRRNSSSSFSND